MYRPSANCPFRSEVMVPKEQARVAASTDASDRHGEGDDEGILVSKIVCSKSPTVSKSSMLSFSSAASRSVCEHGKVKAGCTVWAGTTRIGVGRGWLLGWEGKSLLGVYSILRIEE